MRELTRRPGLFGLIRVIERNSDGVREYRIGASLQTMALADGVSCFGYVHAIKLLLRGAHAVLIVGGAGASLATMMARRGHDVTVVDIDPAAEDIARQYFNLDPRVRWIQEDAQIYFSRLDAQFDAVVIDACDSNGLTPPFENAHALAQIARRACPRGVLVVNLVGADGAPSSGPFLASRLAAFGLHVALHSPSNGWEGNEVLQASLTPRSFDLPLADAHERPSEARTYLMSLRTACYAPSFTSAAP